MRPPTRPAATPPGSATPAVSESLRSCAIDADAADVEPRGGLRRFDAFERFRTLFVRDHVNAHGGRVPLPLRLQPPDDVRHVEGEAQTTPRVLVHRIRR